MQEIKNFSYNINWIKVNHAYYLPFTLHTTYDIEIFLGY